MIRKLILFTALSFCLVFSASAWNPMMVVSGTSPDYSDIIFWLNFENGPTSATGTYTLDGSLEYSASDTTGVLGSSAVINVTAKKDGTYGLDVPTSYDRMRFTSIGNFAAEGRVGMWIYLNSWSDNNTITYIQYTGSNDRIGFKVAGESAADIEFSFLWTGNTTVATTLESDGASVATASWIFVEFAWKQSTPIRKIYINGVERGSSSTAMTAMAGEFNGFNLEELTGVSLDYYIARVMVSTDSTRDLNAIKDTINYPG